MRLSEQLASSRRAAWLGVFAVLFQALLFGWHHHPVRLVSHGAPALAAPAPDQPLSPLTADDDCEICAALHHHSAAPLAFAGLPPPPAAAGVILPHGRAACDSTAALSFQARAPPRA